MATILVVDENHVERRVMRMTLEGEGHRVAEASDGAQALRLVASFAFDVVVAAMDLAEVDGYSLIAKIRTLEGRESTQFIAVLEQMDEKGPVESFMAGASDIIVRPFGAHDLRAVIERASAKDTIDVRDRLVGIQLDAYETAVRLQKQARR